MSKCADLASSDLFVHASTGHQGVADLREIVGVVSGFIGLKTKEK